MHREDGITLVEIMLSLLILGVVLSAFFQVLARNLQSLSDSRARQEASYVTTEVIEQARDIDATEVAMVDTFPDAAVSCGGTAGEVDVFGDGSLCEALAKTPNGQIDASAPWDDVSGAVEYATYATLTGSDPEDPVRVTVVVEYELTRGPQVIRRSTLISEAGRG